MEKEIEKVLKAIEGPLKEKDILVDNVYFEEEDGASKLFVVVDAGVVDLDMCIKATEIINPIIDSLNLDFGEYILDVSGKVRDK